MADIFISYAKKDRSRVEPIAKALEDHGWTVWWDRAIPGGKTWDEVIEEDLDAAKCVIVVWSKISVSSRWVRAEAEEGLKRNILVPVSIEDTKIPLLFRPIQAVRLIHWQQDSNHPQFEKLISDLSLILGPSPLKAKEAEQLRAEGKIDVARRAVPFLIEDLKDKDKKYGQTGVKNRLYSEMKFRPTLVIGLGGLGTNIARNVSWWVKKLTGKNNLPPFLKILGIDTDTQPTGKDMDILTSGNQFVYLGGFSAARLLNAYEKNKSNPRLQYLKVFHQVDLKPGQIHRGAHGIPMIGHLCYAYNRESALLGNLTNTILELLDFTMPYKAKNENYDIQSGQPTLSIHIISSVCGGTGAGILLDIALDIRQFVLSHAQCDPDMVAHLVLPPVFKKGYNPLDSLHHRNAYYLLKQVDYLMGGNRKEDIFSSFGNVQTSVLHKEETIFDMIYLTNRRITNKETTERHIGRMITALIMEPIGREFNSIWDKIRVEMLDCDPIKAYSGYGIKTFVPMRGSEKKRLIRRAFIKGFAKYVRNLDAKVDSLDETIIEEVQENIVGRVYDAHKVDVSFDELIDLNIEGDSFWEQEYLSLSKTIIKEIKSRELNQIIEMWFDDVDKGFMSSEKAKERLQEQEKEFYVVKDLKKVEGVLENPNLPPFLLYGPLSGASEPELSFLQTSFTEGESAEERDYQSCYVSPNCDWILCKTILGFELGNINDFNLLYKDHYFHSVKSQPLTWITPLFNIKSKTGKSNKSNGNDQFPVDIEEVQKIFSFTDEEIKEIERAIEIYRSKRG